MKFTSFLIFGAGVALGVGATCAIKSRRGRKLAMLGFVGGVQILQSLLTIVSCFY